jgi:YVTN family beta-propeller protein
MSPDGRFVYTALARDGLVVEVDTRTGMVTRQIPVTAPRFVALSPDGTTLAVTGLDQPVLTLFARANGAEIAQIPFGNGAFAPAFTLDGRGIYVAEANDPRVDVVDVASRRVTGSVTLKLPAMNVAFSPDGALAYAHGEDNKLTIIDTATGSPQRTLPLPADNSASIAVSPDGSRVYVVDQDRDTLLVAGLPPR